MYVSSQRYVLFFLIYSRYSVGSVQIELVDFIEKKKRKRDRKKIGLREGGGESRCEYCMWGMKTMNTIFNKKRAKGFLGMYELGPKITLQKTSHELVTDFFAFELATIEVRFYKK